MKKSEFIFSVIVLVLIGVLITGGIWKHRAINAKPVYVLAKIYKVEEVDDLIYLFKYYYNSKEYRSGIKGGYMEDRDSIILLKISRTNPKLWERIEGRIPQCLAKDSLLTKSWTEYPLCK